jgi:hypothetical protein
MSKVDQRRRRAEETFSLCISDSHAHIDQQLLRGGFRQGQARGLTSACSRPLRGATWHSMPWLCAARGG